MKKVWIPRDYRFPVSDDDYAYAVIPSVAIMLLCVVVLAVILGEIANLLF